MFYSFKKNTRLQILGLTHMFSQKHISYNGKDYIINDLIDDSSSSRQPRVVWQVLLGNNWS